MIIPLYKSIAHFLTVYTMAYAKKRAWTKSDEGTPQRKLLFPHYFLPQYGRRYDTHSDKELFERLKKFPGVCEWFRRPDFAMSETAATLSLNLETIKDAKDDILQAQTTEVITDSYQHLTESLKRLNSKDEDKQSPDKNDIKKMLRLALKEDKKLDEALDKAYEASAALYLSTIHLKVMRQVLRQPQLYATMAEGTSQEAKNFVSDKSVTTMRAWFEKSILNQSNSVEVSLPTNLEAELSADSEEEVAEPSTTSKKKRNAGEEHNKKKKHKKSKASKQ